MPSCHSYPTLSIELLLYIRRLVPFGPTSPASRQCHAQDRAFTALAPAARAKLIWTGLASGLPPKFKMHVLLHVSSTRMSLLAPGRRTHVQSPSLQGLRRYSVADWRGIICPTSRDFRLSCVAPLRGNIDRVN